MRNAAMIVCGIMFVCLASGCLPAADAGAQAAAPATAHVAAAPTTAPTAAPAKAPAPANVTTTAPVPARKPATIAAPTTLPVGGDVMAYVNGKPIYMNLLNDLLVRTAGLSLADDLVRLELVEQASAKQGVTASEADLAAEQDRFLKLMLPQVEQPEQRELLLQQLMQSRNITPEQWRMSLRSRVLLRRMVEGDAKASDEEISEAFGQQYGRKVVVSHIQVSSLAEAQKIRQEAEKGDFAALAKEKSKNPATAVNGGKLPAFGAGATNIPPAMLDAALAMKKVGELSDPVQIDKWFHVLRMDEIIEPQNVKLADVKDKLVAAIKEQKIRGLEQTRLQELSKQAKIEFVNPILKHQDEARRQTEGSTHE